jgi:cysteine synthase A
MPDWLSSERINLIRSLGADIRLVSKEEGGFLGSIARSEELAASVERAFLPRQFSNEDNSTAHAQTTGPEIWWQFRFRNMRPDAFVAGVGTGGTIMGAGLFLRGHQPHLKVHPLEPSNSPTLSTGSKVGKHRIQGISDEFIPPIVDLAKLDQVVSVGDGDAILMAQKLASELGIGVGISSGANFLGAVEVQNRLGDDAIVVSVFPDDNKKYLSTDLLREEPAKQGYLAPDVKLTGFRGFKRVLSAQGGGRVALAASAPTQPATKSARNEGRAMRGPPSVVLDPVYSRVTAASSAGCPGRSRPGRRPCQRACGPWDRLPPSPCAARRR